MIAASHLRVYQPSELMPALPAAVAVERPLVGSRYGLLGESMIEDGFDTEWRGEKYTCPRTPKLRVLQSVLAVRRSYGRLGGAVIPESVAVDARRELAFLHAEGPAMRPHILTSAWHVPMRWFVPFSPHSREVLVLEEHLVIRYRTDLISAIGRLDQAIDILESTSVPDAVASEVTELKEWVGEFSVESMLELDYGRVADMFSKADLAMDESVNDVWAALEALRVGDWGEAGIHYSKMVNRWSGPMSVSYSN